MNIQMMNKLWVQSLMVHILLCILHTSFKWFDESNVQYSSLILSAHFFVLFTYIINYSIIKGRLNELHTSDVNRHISPNYAHYFLIYLLLLREALTLNIVTYNYYSKYTVRKFNERYRYICTSALASRELFPSENWGGKSNHIAGYPGGWMLLYSPFNYTTEIHVVKIGQK